LHVSFCGSTVRPMIAVARRRTQEERSATTRGRLLDATVECLAELGYARTTTTEIAERGGVSRGAQLHHFPTKAELVTEAVGHLFDRRDQEFRDAFARLPDDARRGSTAVDLLWSMVEGPTFHAWLELVVAARTDVQLEPKVKALTSDMPACVRGLAEGADWIVFGTPKLDSKGTGEIVIGGRWQRSDVIGCIDDPSAARKTKDGAEIYQLADIGWLDFVDDHTAYIAVRPEMKPDAVHALVKRGGGGAEPLTRALLAKLPADRTIAFAVGGKAKVDWSSMMLLPTGSDVFGWARITDKGMELDAGADTHDAKSAKAAAAVIRPQIGEFVLIGQLALAERDGRVARGHRPLGGR